MVFIWKPTGIKSFFLKVLFRQKKKIYRRYDFEQKTLCFFPTFYDEYFDTTQSTADRITRCALLKIEMKQKF